MIEFKNVYKTYDNKVYVLNDLNFKIGDGEFVFIVGHSGAGKSTLVKLMLHQEKSTSGEIDIGGYRVDKLRESKVPYLRRKIGFVTQDFQSFENKTAYENVAFALEITGTPRREINDKVEKFLALVELPDKANVYPRKLSGGEQQRLCLARALVNNPDIIIADEPTGNLDPDLSNGIMDLLLTINQKVGKTVIVVTHEKELVDRYKQRVITLEQGRIINDRNGGTYYEEI